MASTTSTIASYVKTTDSNHNLARAEYLVKRRFESFNVNEAWCGNITYIPTEEGWLYLVSVVDLDQDASWATSLDQLWTLT